MLKTLKKAQAGFTIIELLIVIAIIGILAGLVLNNFRGAQAKARDTERRSDVKILHTQLEIYYDENSGYPNVNVDNSVLEGADGEAFNAPGNGGSLASSFSTATTVPNPSVTSAANYAYAGYGCTEATTTALPAVCEKYILRTFLESEEDDFTQNSLN